MKHPTELNKNKNKDIVTIGDERTGEEQPSYICNFCNANFGQIDRCRRK